MNWSQFNHDIDRLINIQNNIISMLVDARIDLNLQNIKGNNTPLVASASSNLHKCIDFIIKHNPPICNPNMQ